MSQESTAWVEEAYNLLGIIDRHPPKPALPSLEDTLLNQRVYFAALGRFLELIQGKTTEEIQEALEAWAQAGEWAREE